MDWENGGWWVTASTDHGLPGDDAVRLYWNVGTDGVGDVVAALTGILEKSSLPWAFKCPILPAGYARRDSTVLLLPAGGWDELAPGLREVRSSLAFTLREGVPPLTKELARGVGLAEDPGDGRSFGESRCVALAEAMVAMRAQGSLDASDGLEVLSAHLAGAGIDPARPYLRANHDASYEL
jgi:hypothetical protein